MKTNVRKCGFCFLAAVSALAVPANAQNAETLPDAGHARPLPPPEIRVADLRKGEKPVAIGRKETIVAENAFFRRVKTEFTFTNPNARPMAGELEFPVPEGGCVCAYSLEIDGTMVPGVVCEKEKARVAFENEVRKGVDPGIVEQVKGNVWRTRIFPLSPKTPRRAEVEFIAPIPEADAPKAKAEAVYERDGDDVFAAASGTNAAEKPVSAKIASFAEGVILWDASLSAKPFASGWKEKAGALPKKGSWKLVVFRNEPEEARVFDSRDGLLAAIDAIAYDGGTDIGAATGKYADDNAPVLLFSDETDTLGLSSPEYDGAAGLVVASRDDAPARAVEVRKLGKGEKPPAGAEVKDGTLLATVWAARRMEDLASQAGSRKEEFLALGRRYGVAGPGLSLIVFERLEQWLEYKIEPPASLAIHDEWMRRRAAEDDPIAFKKEKAEHERMLLQYWEERVKWWNSPKPAKKTPSSGLFDSETTQRTAAAMTGNARRGAASARAANDMEMATGAEPPAPAAEAMSAMASRAGSAGGREKAPGQAGSGSAPSVTLKAWDPKTPYIEALKAAGKGEAYGIYLAQREKYAGSPAFYLDCAGWFFKAGETKLAVRILTNLAEFKLENAALWRAMGWRAREAGAYPLAELAFRKVLAMRGEEAQSRRDLALVLSERGKDEKKAAMVEEAMKLLADAAFTPRARRSGRRGNDFQVSTIALEELNGLVSWAESTVWPDGTKPAVPEFDAAYRRDLPVKLRIVLSWDADETDIDLHVLEPNGEEAFYQNRRTAEGGFVSEDVTTGYGPEEYLKKDMESGSYKVLANYFASHQTALTGAVAATATVYTDWATEKEERRILTLRLDAPKSKYLVGEVKL